MLQGGVKDAANGARTRTRTRTERPSFPPQGAASLDHGLAGDDFWLMRIMKDGKNREPEILRGIGHDAHDEGHAFAVAKFHSLRDLFDAILVEDLEVGQIRKQ